MEDSVLFSEHDCQDGHRIGVITLNKPKQLHALSEEMFPLIHAQLSQWQENDAIACVVLTSTGERAFCAGGDVKSLQQALVKAEDETAQRQLVTEYFTKEYTVDHMLHVYPKPIIVWGDGIIMGGGLGLFMGCSHRVVTETARIAMPEITIGLFPDVGATWFLNRLPHAGVGLFLGLTGASINALDAQYLELSPYAIPASQQVSLLENLQAVTWTDADSHQLVDNVLEGMIDKSVFPQAQLPAYQAFFNELAAQPDLAAVMTLIQQHDNTDKWFVTSRNKLLQGSPISAHILYRQISQFNDLSLAECFRLELDLAVSVCLQGDLQEGVRALLVDKDNQPKWRYSDCNAVPNTLIDEICQRPWPISEHPLAKLGLNSL